MILPRDIAKTAPQNTLLEEGEWRGEPPLSHQNPAAFAPTDAISRVLEGLGVQQSRGWVHYAIHRPEPHILLFRRPLGNKDLPTCAACVPFLLPPQSTTD